MKTRNLIHVFGHLNLLDICEGALIVRSFTSPLLYSSLHDDAKKRSRHWMEEKGALSNNNLSFFAPLIWRTAIRFTFAVLIVKSLIKYGEILKDPIGFFEDNTCINTSADSKHFMGTSVASLKLLEIRGVHRAECTDIDFIASDSKNWMKSNLAPLTHCQDRARHSNGWIPTCGNVNEMP